MNIRKSGLKTKILIIYVSLILIPFTLMFIIFSVKSMNEMKNNYISFMKDNNAQLNLRINTLIGDIDRAYYLQSFDSQVQQILSKTNKTTGMEYITDVRKMNNLLVSSSRLSSFNYEAVYVARNGEYYTGYNQTPSNKNQIPKLIPELRQLKAKSLVTGIYKGIDGSDYISVDRMLINSNTLKENGFVFVNMKLQEIQRYFSMDSGKFNSSNMAIINDKDIIFESRYKDSEIASDSQSIIKAINDNWSRIENKSLVLKIGKDTFQVVGISSDVTGWKIVQYQPISIINKYAVNSVYFYVITMIPALLLFIVLGYFLSSRILQPIEKLKAAMKQVKDGIFVKVKEDNIRDDEMGSLIKSYNRMVVQLEESINQNYKTKLNQKRIEFKMLEAQINPHFLYNTLNLISSISEIEGIEEIGIITSSLSDMFRYNVQKGSIVCIKDELNQIKNYMNIQKYRFLGKINFECTVSEKIENYHILKFLLQPLVENALYHGIEKKEGPCHLSIKFREENDTMYITIEDDGAGMEEKTLENLKEKLNKKEEFSMQDKFEHIGIENVNSRIKHYYGDQYELDIWSEKNVGTRIQIIIPVVKEV